MVASPNNYGSIVGGIIRGLSNDRRSAGLTGHNVTNDNPLSFTYIGQETSDLRQPISKESSQNPSLPFTYTTPGTQYDYSQMLPNDIPTFFQQGSPGTNVGIRTEASSAGSQTLVPPTQVPINNAQVSGYGMSPQNGDHFKQYFANQIGLNNALPKAIPALTSLAIESQQDSGTTGNSDVWANTWQTFIQMRKGYQPLQAFLAPYG